MEKDERFSAMARARAMELCRRMRAEEYYENEVVAGPGQVDTKAGRGVVRTPHSTDVETANRVRASV